MQRIEVKNFGPLKDITLDIKDYMIFIGPQASGKSTLAKLIYFCKWIDTQRYIQLVKYGATLLTQKDVSNNLFIKSFPKIILDSFGLYFKGNYVNNYEFKAIFDGYSICYRNGIFELSDDFIIEFEFIKKYHNTLLGYEFVKINQNIGNRNSEIFVENIINYNIGDSRVRTNQENIFIPTQRHLIDLIEERSLPDHFLVDYKRFINTTNPYILAGITTDSKFIKHKNLILKLSFDILKGEFAYVGNKRKVLYFDVDKYVTLNEASSGQQEAIWIIETIKELFSSINSEKELSCNLLIEEPETHLFPDAQRDITYLISLLANQPTSKVIITTHSPYVLAALNNLIEAHIVGNGANKKDAVSKIINTLLWVDPQRLYVGYLDQGSIANILDQETSLIKHEVLDGVSNEIMSKFDELLEIQYNE